MPKTRPPYPAVFRQQVVEQVRSGRTPEELPREVYRFRSANQARVQAIHTRNRTKAAYARSDLFERRRHLVKDWASVDRNRPLHTESRHVRHASGEPSEHSA